GQSRNPTESATAKASSSAPAKTATAKASSSATAKAATAKTSSSATAKTAPTTQRRTVAIGPNRAVSDERIFSEEPPFCTDHVLHTMDDFWHRCHLHLKAVA